MNSKDYENQTEYDNNEYNYDNDYNNEYSKQSYENTVNTTDPFMIKHRKRTSKKQLEVLEKTFETCIRPDSKCRKKLGDQLNMTPRAVQIWFQNRRAKIKKLNGEYKITKKKAIIKKNKRMEYDSYNVSYGYSNSVQYEGEYKEAGGHLDPQYFQYADIQYNEMQYGDMQCQDGGQYQNQYTNEARYNSEIYGNTVPNYYDFNNENINNNMKYQNYETMYPQYNNNHSEYYHNMYLRNNSDNRVGYPPQKYESYYYYDENNTNGENDFVDRREE